MGKGLGEGVIMCITMFHAFVGKCRVSASKVFKVNGYN